MEKKFPKKNLAMPKKIERGDPSVWPGMVCYAGKQEKPFWFHSLGQMVQFGAIIFCRTFRTILVSSCGLKKNHLQRRLKTRCSPILNIWTFLYRC